MSELAVVGSQPFTLGFRLAGIRRIWETGAGSEDELERAVALARKDPDVSILILETKDVSRLSPRTKSELVSSVKPTLVAVGLDEDNTLREKIKQAVGVDLW
jgi:V/A-type H+/Na+-transporting ATPase subunit F